MRCRSCQDPSPVDRHGYCVHCAYVLIIHGIAPYGPVAPRPTLALRPAMQQLRRAA